VGVLIPFRRLISMAEVRRLTGLSRQQVYYRIEHACFPRAVMKVGPVVRWLRRDVQQWVKRKATAPADRQARRAARSITAPAGSSAPTSAAT
jgi:predicted DNA-binding transcriptional regulator AlpA